MEATMADSTPSFYSDVPISVPVVLPSEEEYDMGGFAWSRRFGMLIKMNRDGDPIDDVLKSLKQQSKYVNRREN